MQLHLPHLKQFILFTKEAKQTYDPNKSVETLAKQGKLFIEKFCVPVLSLQTYQKWLGEIWTDSNENIAVIGDIDVVKRKFNAILRGEKN